MPATEPTYDVVVVGAGPAGAAAARAAAAAGARTVLLERAEIPRYKCCGGGLVGLSQAAVPVDLAPLQRDAVSRVTFTDDGGHRRTRRGPQGRPLFRLVFRAELDEALVHSAEAAGAVLRTGSVLTGITESDGTLTLATRGGEVTARAVVGADGASGRTGAYVGVECDQVDVGLEAEIPTPPGTAGHWRGRVLLDWGPVPGSYGWVFPKGDLLTVGVIGSRRHGPALRAYYRDFLQRLGLDAIEPVTDSGHLTRCRRPGSPLRRGAVLVAGDAAGLLDPWTREGISYALRSGRLAGLSAGRAALALRAGDQRGAEGALRTYDDWVGDVLEPEMAAGRAVLAAFERHRRVFHELVTVAPGGWRMFGRITAGDTTLARQLRRPGVSAALARLAH
ncbi:MAG: geranylgeranyl reductase family protein [Actinomycetota bacterium]|nr:geranylgeranyl reductase family protein [Actinomycetota bacterium]